MKVCFVLNDLGLSGGTAVVLEHANQLATRHGVDVTLAVTGDGASRWEHRPLQRLKVTSLSEAGRDRYDVAVATWWKTCYDVFSIPAESYAYFVQSLEDRFYRPPEGERVLAAATYALPVAFITEARWIADHLRELQPGAPVHLVRNGIAKDVFSHPEPPEPNTRGPLRVLLEGHPDVWFKGIQECAQVLREMREPHAATYVSPSGDDCSPASGADRVIGPLSQRQLAREYAVTDVVLKMSRVEGMYGPPLEGFHMGATCVTTPVTGHDEFIEHGWNALVFDWDDAGGGARLLDLLAHDRRLLHFLRTNAWLTARDWPAWEQSGDFMAAALTAVRRSSARDPHPPAARMLHELVADASEKRRERERGNSITHRLQADLHHAQQDVRNVLGEADALRAELTERRDEQARLARSDAWRIAMRITSYSQHPLYRAARRVLRILRGRVPSP